MPAERAGGGQLDQPITAMATPTAITAAMSASFAHSGMPEYCLNDGLSSATPPI